MGHFHFYGSVPPPVNNLLTLLFHIFIEFRAHFHHAEQQHFLILYYFLQPHINMNFIYFFNIYFPRGDHRQCTRATAAAYQATSHSNHRHFRQMSLSNSLSDIHARLAFSRQTLRRATLLLSSAY